MQKIVFLLLINIILNNSYAQEFKLNNLDYFEKQGVNLFVFSGEYNGMFFDEKTAGIELIQHGVRTMTGGAIRLQNTPEQWDLIPELTDRIVDSSNNSITVKLSYKELNFNSTITVTPKDDGVEISVYLEEPIPDELIGKAGLNLELLPSAYFEKTYIADQEAGVFPKYPSGPTETINETNKIIQFKGHRTFDDRGLNRFINPIPLAEGSSFTLAAEDPERRIKITSYDNKIMLFDGRNIAQNGWYVFRSLLPANKTGKVLTWTLQPNGIKNWVRQPVIGFSQAGYTPQQKKLAVIELDKSDVVHNSASVFKINAEGEAIEVLTGTVNEWGKYLRYNYATFNFTEISEPGIYYIQYAQQKTNTFVIGPNVYENIWHPTMDVWFPVQMDHMKVNEAYRTWHGISFLDDCLQAPLNHEHFDGYSQGSTTDTKYKPLERIPGMAIGGWYDAGDFDIQTGSHNQVITNFVEVWENFKIQRDQTYINQKTRYVDIHHPDGYPDILQQIEHGILNLVAQVENIGHPVRGIIVPNLHQYHHLGDASTETDNLPYNPDLEAYESNGISSGTLDDRWAFTNRSVYLDYQTAATLAAANRALKGYNDTLAEKCLTYAVKLLTEADEVLRNNNNDSSEPWMRRFRESADLNTVLQLYMTTKDQKYADRFKEKIWKILDQPSENRDFGQVYFISRQLNPALKAVPYMDAAYKEKLKSYITKYKEQINQLYLENPYGVPISYSGWGGSGMVVNFALTNYYAYKTFPDIMNKEYVFSGLNYVLGCHPYSNLSFVNGIGTRSKNVAYGINRADFTTIAGGIVPGVLLIKPDFLENKDDWPFFWGENEVTIGGSSEYVLLSLAVNELIKM